MADIFLIFASEWKNKNRLPHVGSNWLYLGNSYGTLLKWENILGESSLIPFLADKVERKTKALRRPYIELIGSIGDRLNSLAWDLSRVAEKNDSKLFLNCCHLSIAIDEIEKKRFPMLIVIEDYSLSESIEDEVVKRKLGRVKKLYSKSVLERISDGRAVRTYQYLKSAVGFLKRNLRQKTLANKYLPVNKDVIFRDKSVFLHTFTNDSCFHPDGEFREKYFGKLNSLIRQWGKNLVIIPNINFCGMEIVNILKWCGKSKESFIFIVQFITLMDILKAVFLPLKISYLKIGKCIIEDKDVTGLFRKQLSDECRSPFNMEAYMYYCFIKNIAGNILKIDLFVDVYEGHILERAIRRGLKDFMPHCRTVCFAHAAFCSNQLCYFPSKGTASSYLLPSIIFCTGKGYRDVLVNEGVPRDILKISGSFRYERVIERLYSENNVMTVNKGNNIKKKIILALPLSIEDATELFIKGVAAFKDTDFNVVVCRHPMMSEKYLLSLVGTSLPNNFCFSKKTTGQEIMDCDLILCTATTVSIEGIALGIPVITLKRSCGLTIDPVDWFDSGISYCNTSLEIRKVAEYLLSQSGTERDQRISKGKATAKHCFELVDEKHVSLIKEIFTSC